MKKASKKVKKIKVITVCNLVLVAVLIVALSLSFIKILKPNYSVSSRVDNIKEYNKKYSKKFVTQFWLRVQGTNIDYPVLYNARGLDEAEGDYTWTNGKYESVPNRLLILGHNIKNLSANPIKADDSHTRFEQLPSFLYYDFAKDNKYVQLTFENEDYLYKIFAVSIINDDELEYDGIDYDKEELDTEIKKAIDESIYDYDIDVNSSDKIISLVTCTRIYGPTSDYDLKIDARMVRKGELASNYKVSRNKKYEKIENAMRGDNYERGV